MERLVALPAPSGERRRLRSRVVRHADTGPRIREVASVAPVERAAAEASSASSLLPAV